MSDANFTWLAGVWANSFYAPRHNYALGVWREIKVLLRNKKARPEGPVRLTGRPGTPVREGEEERP
ncbi:MAG: hypothetical protein VCB60_07385, partial [Alphaproteobacteria bacterium]